MLCARMEGVTDADVRGVTGEILAIVIARLDGYDDDAGPAGRRLSSWQVDDRGHAVLVRRATRESLRGGPKIGHFWNHAQRVNGFSS